MQETNFHWETFRDFGNEYLQQIFSGNIEFGDKFIRDHLFSERLKNETQKEKMLNLENKFSRTETSERDKNQIRAFIAYSLSQRTDIVINNASCKNTDDVIKTMRDLQKEDFNKFKSLCSKLINEKGELDPVFERWLLIAGYKDELDAWKNG